MGCDGRWVCWFATCDIRTSCWLEYDDRWLDAYAAPGTEQIACMHLHLVSLFPLRHIICTWKTPKHVPIVVGYWDPKICDATISDERARQDGMTAENTTYNLEL